MRRVAIPLYENKLSEYFGQCSHYEIFEINNKIIKSKRLEHPPLQDIKRIPYWVASQGITDVITYRIDKKIISLFSNTKINLFVGVPINSPEALIENYLNGSLKSDLNIINELTKN